MIRFVGKVLGLERVRRKLHQVRNASRDLRPVWRDSKSAFRAEQKRHFSDQVGPDGPWAPLARSTMDKRQARPQGEKRRRRRKRPKLLGKLRSFSVRTNRRSMLALSRVPWSGVHQAGGRVHNGARIPARPFLWIDQRWLKRNVVTNIRRHIRRAFRS